MEAVGRIVFSGWIQLARLILAVASILTITGGYRIMFDVATYVFPVEYIPMMLAAAFVGVLCVGTLAERRLFEKAADNKVKEGKIENESDLERDPYYHGGTFFAMAIAAGFALYVTPILVHQHILNAGMMTYSVISFIIACFAVYVAVHLVHTGLRLTLIRWKDYCNKNAPVIKDTIDNTVDVIETLKRE